MNDSSTTGRRPISMSWSYTRSMPLKSCTARPPDSVYTPRSSHKMPCARTARTPSSSWAIRSASRTSGPITRPPVRSWLSM